MIEKQPRDRAFKKLIQGGGNAHGTRVQKDLERCNVWKLLYQMTISERNSTSQNLKQQLKDLLSMFMLRVHPQHKLPMAKNNLIKEKFTN